MSTLGILGAGKLGTTIGRLAAGAGWTVLLSDASADPMLPLIVSTMIPGATLVEPDELAGGSDVVVLALPFAHVPELDVAALSGRVVVDATNPWSTDGTLPGAAAGSATSSDFVASLNPAMRVVRSLNHLAYADLAALALPAGHPMRRAIAVASDDAGARAAVAALVDDLGFDPVPRGWDEVPALAPDAPLFGAPLSAAELAAALDAAARN